MLHEHAPDGLRSGRLRFGMTSDPPVESGEQIRLRSNYNRLTLSRRDRAASFLWNLSCLRHGGNRGSTQAARREGTSSRDGPGPFDTAEPRAPAFNTSSTARR